MAREPRDPELIDLDAYEFSARALPDLLSLVGDWTEEHLSAPPPDGTNWDVDLRLEYHPDPDTLIAGFWSAIVYVTRRLDPRDPRRDPRHPDLRG